jgi:hypothetical protein
MVGSTPDNDDAPVTASAGFPDFEHGQFTFEGEIERLGAFSRGARHAKGWQRGLAIFLALLFIVPILAGVVGLVYAAVRPDAPAFAQRRECQDAGAATVCLVGRGDQFDVELSGLQPGSSVRSTDSQGGGLRGIADDRGRTKPGGAIGVGPSISETVSGVDANGRPFTVDLVWLSDGFLIPIPTTGAVPQR